MLSDAFHSLFAWLVANKAVVFAVVVWLVANVAPRPHPEDLVGWKKNFWTLVDRLCVLEAGVLPGKLKWLFAATGTQKPTTDTPTDPSKDNSNGT